MERIKVSHRSDNPPPHDQRQAAEGRKDIQNDHYGPHLRSPVTTGVVEVTFNEVSIPARGTMHKTSRRSPVSGPRSLRKAADRVAGEVVITPGDKRGESHAIPRGELT